MESLACMSALTARGLDSRLIQNAFGYVGAASSSVVGLGQQLMETFGLQVAPPSFEAGSWTVGRHTFGRSARVEA